MLINLKNKSLQKGGASFIILFFVLTSIAPVFVPMAHAQFAVIDPAHIAVTKAESFRKGFKDWLDLGARVAAQVAIQQIVNSTVDWAQNGFDGNPAYVTDPKQYFTDLADGTAINFLDNPNGPLSFLCSPFKLRVQLALRKQYLQPTSYQCTWTGVAGNLENFYGDFNQGGWDSWFNLTQTSGGNQYDAFLTAKVDLDTRVANAVGLSNDELNRNQGFLSWKECPAGSSPVGSGATSGPSPADYGTCYYPGAGTGGTTVTGQVHSSRAACEGPGTTFTADSQSGGGAAPAPGQCADSSGNIVQQVIVTPGTVIGGQLQKVLPAGLDRLINVQQADQLIDAFASGILSRYVFSKQGLFKGGSGAPDLGQKINGDDLLFKDPGGGSPTYTYNGVSGGSIYDVIGNTNANGDPFPDQPNQTPPEP